MQHLQDQDISKLKELLRHTGEFIAYFELAETKMLEWRHDIEQQAQIQQTKAQQQLQSLHNELDALQEVLTQAGLARFRLAAEKLLQQGEERAENLEKLSQNFLEQFDYHQQEFNRLLEKGLAQIEQYAIRAIERMDEHFSQYDVQQFRRITSESCEQIERVANNAVRKSQGLLGNFQWRAATLAIITTLITAFAIGFYVSNELPWEIHEHVKNEREAGKVLIKAWPILTQEEKDKILNNQKPRV
ncbi:hypothetical protein [Legionella jordanis]|uniref:Uncharacterized protein n=1 Tax=Legionella jordanis TaxID=456 RepID=A0A0W0VD57_9GAMM|nr:hypothetical protein [Legionella jordanis]KTD18024.1 hypothetical protein Ljor_2330 [Legionella jordanis]RMX02289.1 hypothetical protein EAW55_08495 [Legionella jordanis]RMX21226.1 hypothetical protein EAS68_03375 [Legionella jordanis]VEH13884.1 Uncharacterised protein [Legionella jordanis]HAT8714266.1 hypothetical protein [Legionella jordanis]